MSVGLIRLLDLDLQIILQRHLDGFFEQVSRLLIPDGEFLFVQYAEGQVAV